MFTIDKYVYALYMFVCLHSHMGLYCNLDLYGQPLQKLDTIFIIQIFHNGQYLYMYCRWRFIDEEGNWDHIKRFIPATFLCLKFQRHMSW